MMGLHAPPAAMGRLRRLTHLCYCGLVSGTLVSGNLITGGLLAGGLALPSALRAAPKEISYPSADLWRKLQLTVLECGRENTAASCDLARSTADPLLDHPQLPATCKDNLWTIRDQAVVAASNSYARRERLNKAASELLPLCRERISSPAKNNKPDQGGKTNSLLKF
jgi:hypothetical protein